MQVQHEICLIEPVAPKYSEHARKSLDSYCLNPSLSNSLSPIEQIACCPPSCGANLLAVHLSASNQIVVIDTKSHKRRDKFPLKSYDKKYSRHSFNVSGLAFSPDGQRLAVGQTDCIIYIYKLVPAVSTSQSALAPARQVAGADQGSAGAGKTTITGKFASSSPITCLIWSEWGIIFGGQDGKVRLILSFNKPPAPLSPSAQHQSSDTTRASSGQQKATTAAQPQQQQTQTASSKVVTLFTSSKQSASPISLAYKAPILLIGLANSKIQVLILAANMDEIGSASLLLSANSTDQVSATSDLMGQLALNTTSRRSSSSSTAAGQVAPAVLQSHTVEHSCPPVHLNIINLVNSVHFCCAGSDGKLTFHSLKVAQQQAPSLLGGAGGQQVNGNGGGRLSIATQVLQVIDVREDILAMDFSSINEILALATKDRLMFVRHEDQAETSGSEQTAAGSSASWRLQASTIELRRRTLALTCVRWLRDGTQLALGAANSTLELFKCQWSKQSMGDKVDICHIARNRIRITDRERNLLATYKTTYDIKRVNLLDAGQSVLVWTTSSLLLARLSGLQSEIKWPPNFTTASKASGGGQSSSSSSKFLFRSTKAPDCCFVIIFHETTRELHLLKLGEDRLKYSVKLPVAPTSSSATTTQLVKRDLLSVRQFPLPEYTSATNREGQSPNRRMPSKQLGASSGNAAGSSRQTSAARSSSGSQRNSLATVDGVQLSHQQAPLDEEDGELAPTRHEELPVGDSAQFSGRQIERFAYLKSSCELEIVDLKRTSQQVIVSHRHAHSIEFLDFSHTGRLLAFLDSEKQLNLLKILPLETHDDVEDNGQVHRDSTTPSDALELAVKIELSILLTSCESHKGAIQWLPESDSLLAQAGPIIYLWHDLHQEPVVLEKFDSTSYNFLQRAPLLDLSLADESGSGRKYPTIRRITESSSSSSSTADAIRFSAHALIAIELSNGQLIQLDSTRTRFYAKLASNSLESALELLDRSSASAAEQNSEKPTRELNLPHARLYSKLGWLAIEQNRSELAWKVFTKLQFKSLVRYLEQCLELEAHNSESALRAKVMLAKLRGAWDKFEQLLSASDHQEEIIATYRRLNKWTRLMDFLARKQQFRARDLAERDQLEWLISRGRLSEAAALKVRSSGDLVGALELLLKFNKLDEASKLVLREQKLPLSVDKGTLTALERRLREVVQSEIVDKLVAEGEGRNLARAGELSERVLGEPERALELYLEAEDFESALRVASAHRELSSRTESIHLRYANSLRVAFLETEPRRISAKRARAAIEHFVAGKQVARALEMANSLRMPARGLELLNTHWDQFMSVKKQSQADDQSEKDLVLAQSRELARQLLEQDERAQACRALEMAEEYEQLIELLILQNDDKPLERAFAVSLEHLNGGNRELTCDKFVELAKSYVRAATDEHNDTSQQQQLVDRAERIFLLVSRPQLAIEMHEKLGNHDRMLELIERHASADQLEASLLQLARSRELAGELEAAEKYLLRASPSEWTSVVRMYRLAKRWPDAFRVARDNCLSEQDPLLVQLAYWWAKSLVVGDAGRVSEARALLDRLKLFRGVIEFSCEAKNFQFALELCNVVQQKDSDESLPRIKRELVLRYATFLEQQHKLEDAERLLVENQLVELAAKMYADNDDYARAIKVIERQLEAAASATQPEVDTSLDGDDDGAQRRQKLVDLLNVTLIECANRIVADLSAVSRRTPPLLMRSQSRASSSFQSPPPTARGDSQKAAAYSDKLQMAQQMFLRAQRPELAIEMYQGLGMWQEAIQVAQRFAPRLLERVERALDEQVQEDIEPILRAQRNAVSGAAARVAVSATGSLDSASSESASGHASNASEQAAQILGNGKSSSRVHSVLATWRQFEFAYRQDDRKSARLQFDAYLSLLLESVSSALSNSPPGEQMRRRKKQPADSTCIQLTKQLRHLERFLQDCRRDATRALDNEPRPLLIGSILRQREATSKLRALTELILSSESSWSSIELTSCVIPSYAVWSSLRNILADCAHLTRSSSTGDELSAPIDERLLVAHYITLYVSLVRSFCQDTQVSSTDAQRLTIARAEQIAATARLQRDSKRASQVLDLLSKLTFALVRHTNLLDLGRVLYLAGLWQVACGHHALARQLWATLVEWHDDTTGSQLGSNGRVTQEKRAAPPPVSLRKFVTNLPETFKCVALSSAQGDSLERESMNHVRQWLLETLIGPTTTGGAPRDTAGDSPAWATQLDANSLKSNCLACGLSIDVGGNGRSTSTTTRIQNDNSRRDCLSLSSQVVLRAHELCELLNLCAENQTPSSSALDEPTLEQLRSALEQRRSASQGRQESSQQRSSSKGGAGDGAHKFREARDQLGEIVDFIIELSSLG